MSFRNSGYRPLTPHTPVHSPQPSVGSIRSRTPGQLSLHEYRKLQASPSPVAVVGQRIVKRKVATSRLHINGSGYGDARMEGVLTAPQTPMDDQFGEMDSEDDEDGYADVPPSVSGIFRNRPRQHAEQTTPPFDFEFDASPPPTPPSLTTVYAQSSDFDFDFPPRIPSPPTARQSTAALSSALNFSRPSSLHHSLRHDSPSAAESQDLHASTPEAPLSRIQQLKPAKRLPRHHPNTQRSHGESTPFLPPSTRSSPFSLSSFDFPDPPVLKDPPLHSSVRTESYSDLLHLYGVSFQMLNHRNSISSMNSTDESFVEESISTLGNVIANYENMPAGLSVHHSAGVVPSFAPPALPTNMPLVAFSNAAEGSTDPASLQLNTLELLGSVEDPRAARTESLLGELEVTHFPSSPTGQYLASLPDPPRFDTPEANHLHTLSFLEGQTTHRVPGTPSPLRHKTGMMFRESLRDRSYHSPVDHPAYLLSAEPNDDFEGPPMQLPRLPERVHVKPPPRSSYGVAVAGQTEPIELMLLKGTRNRDSPFFPDDSQIRNAGLLEAARQQRQMATADRHARRLNLLVPMRSSVANTYNEEQHQNRPGTSSTSRPLISLPSGSSMPLPKVPEPQLRQARASEDNPRLLEAGLNREENYPIVLRQRRLSRWLLAACVTNPLTTLLFYRDKADDCIMWLTKGEIKNVNDDFWRYSKYALWVWVGIIIAVVVAIVVAVSLHYRN